MVTEDYVSFEVAKLLKEKSFNECFCDKSYYANEQVDVKYNIDNHFEEICLAPTLQMTMKWLREIHNIDICVCREIDEHGDCFDGYIAVVYSNKVYKITIRDVEKDLSFEEAAETAIKYCLTNLIQTMKQITITIPDNCELKQDGNTYIITEKEEKLTYEDIAKKLFSEVCCYINSAGEVLTVKTLASYSKNPNNCKSIKQAEKLLAINKLMNVAKYLNGDWQPNWDNNENKYYIYYSNQYGVLRIDVAISIHDNNIFFKSKELAEKAIKILGEDTIKLALCSDY